MGTEPKLHRYTVGAIRWLTIHGDPDFLDAVIRSLEQGTLLLRTTPNRRVLRTPGRPALIIKHFRRGGAVNWLKSIARGDAASREWNALRRAARHGLPVPTAVAVGRRGLFLGRESFLVTEAIEDAVPLGQYLFEGPRAAAKARRRVIEQAAAVLRRAHDAGMFHQDLHLDNLVVRNRETDCRVFLIDLQRVAFRRSLPLSARTVNLAELHGGCAGATASERLRFLKTCLAGLSGVTKDLRPLLARLEKMARTHRQRIWRTRQRRCLAENRDFVRLRFGPYAGYGRRDWSEESILTALSRPSELLSSCVIVKDSRTTTVGAGTMGERTIHVKRYNFQGLGYAFKDLFRASRAKRAWIAGNSCVMRDISVATPIAYLERRHGRILVEGYLIVKTIEGVNLTEIMFDGACSNSEKPVLIEGLARYLARMHSHQVANRDLKGNNLIVSRNPSGKYAFSMVDFDGARIGPVAERTRVKNLARLEREFRKLAAVTRADRLRFLRAYLGPRFKDQWKKYWRGILRQSGVD
jgi:tRNA A-37 threonylcarbamoyl transferase component Bud32